MCSLEAQAALGLLHVKVPAFAACKLALGLFKALCMLWGRQPAGSTRRPCVLLLGGCAVTPRTGADVKHWCAMIKVCVKICFLVN
jgi:hypothetical protein